MSDGAPTPRARRRRRTLSVCCIANSPSGFLAAALAPLREIAEEVVLVAGGSLPDGELERYGAIADRLYTIEFDFVERHLAWLHARCRGDWILRLDGDEVPSPAMLEEVSAAVGDDLLQGVYFARRNVYPDVRSYIAQDPWYPDFQLRLVRSDAALRFPGVVHSGPERTLPARMVEAPIYHLPFILGDLDARRARAQRYESLHPGLIAPTGIPASAMELPEEAGALLTAPVPADDLELVLTALGGEPPPPRPEPAAIHVSRAQTDAYWAGRPFAESAYRASVAVLGSLAPLAPRERRPLYMRVRNEGTERWGWDPSVGPYVHVVHRLLDEVGEPLEVWRPSFFGEPVEPGAETIVPAHLDAPELPGRYTLQARVRHAPERVFGDVEPREVVVRPGGAWGAAAPLPPEWTAAP